MRLRCCPSRGWAPPACQDSHLGMSPALLGQAADEAALLPFKRVGALCGTYM